MQCSSSSKKKELLLQVPRNFRKQLLHWCHAETADFATVKASDDSFQSCYLDQWSGLLDSLLHLCCNLLSFPSMPSISCSTSYSDQAHGNGSIFKLLDHSSWCLISDLVSWNHLLLLSWYSILLHFFWLDSNNNFFKCDGVFATKQDGISEVF